jgi:hypothetical protein
MVRILLETGDLLARERRGLRLQSGDDLLAESGDLFVLENAFFLAESGGGILQETGDRILQEDGFAILLDSVSTVDVTDITATLTGPSTGVSGSSSSNFTITLSAITASTITFTPAGNNGTHAFSPLNPQVIAGQSSVSFTDTAQRNGAHLISITNDSGVDNGNPVSYTTSSASNYTRVNGTAGGQNIMVLVPNSVSANPYNAANPTKVVMYIHGHSESETALVLVDQKGTVAQELLDAGYILCASNAHGNSFGNQDALDDYAALDVYMRANYNVLGYGIWGQSMGGLPSLMLIPDGQISDIAGWLGTFPICSLAASYNGTGGVNFQADIDAAFGITGETPNTYAEKTDGYDPNALSAVSFGTVPMRSYASYGDTTVHRAQNADAFQTKVLSSRTEAAVVACTGNHGDVSHFQGADYIQFFDRAFAEMAGSTGIAAAAANFFRSIRS